MYIDMCIAPNFILFGPADNSVLQYILINLKLSK